ncbi:MAG: hypothetical protein Q9181_002775 [Wetmoreana brouardii]
MFAALFWLPLFTLVAVAVPAEKPGPSTSLSLAAKPRFPEYYEWHIPRSTRSLVFSGWGDELPVFDDVIALVERAQLQLQRDIPGDPVMQKIKTWTDGTANLVLVNDHGADGMRYRETVRFLEGLRLSGEVFGFWSCHIAFYDSSFTIRLRGYAQLSIAGASKEKAVKQTA